MSSFNCVSEYHQHTIQYLAILRPNSPAPDCLAIPEEAVCSGTLSSKVRSSKLANRPPSACSETSRPPQQLGAESLATTLPAKRVRPLPQHNPAFSETPLDSRLLSRRTTHLGVEPASSVARLQLQLVRRHPTHNPSEAPCWVVPSQLRPLVGPPQARKAYRPLLRNLLRQMSQFSPFFPRRAHRRWRRQPRRKSTC